MTAKEFKSYVYEWARKIGVDQKVSSIHLRKMKNKIASCSNRGRLTFDISILTEDKYRIDEIIIHELLHYRYPNHGKMFKIMLKRELEN